MRIKTCAWASLTVLLVATINTPALADRMKDRQKRSSEKKGQVFSRFGVRYGILSAGSITWSSRSYDSKSSYSFGLFADQKSGKYLRTGLAIDIYDVNSPDLWGFRRNVADISFEIKAPLSRNPRKILAQPGLAVGFGFMQHNGKAESAYLLCVKFYNEILYFPMKKHGFLLETGFILVPAGNAGGSISTGPIYVIRGGLFL